MTKKKRKREEMPVWKKMNTKAELERRLEAVVESETTNIQVTTVKRSTRRRGKSVKRDGTTQETRVLRLDKKIIDQSGVKSTPKKVQISQRAHETSPYEIRFGRLARNFETEVQRPVMREVHAWLAPFSRPPAPDEIASLANDLRIGSVDPRLFLDQFTPGHAREAYAKSYSWWTAIREPFVRWEHTPVAAHSLAEQKLDLPEPEEEPDIDPTEDFWEKAKAYAHEAVETAREYEEELIGEAQEAVGAPILVPRLIPWRVVTGLVMLLVAVSLPAGAVNMVQSVSSSWLSAEESGKNALSGIETVLSSEEAARADGWRKISKELELTDQALNEVNGLAIAMSRAIPQTSRYYDAARKLVFAGEESAKAGELMSKGLVRAMEMRAQYPIERLELFSVYLDEARPHIDIALEHINSIDIEKLPEEIRGKVEEAKTMLLAVDTSVSELNDLYELLIPMLGRDHQRRYLLVFQNPSEIRPTGGFMGSVADIVIDRGEIKKIFVPGGGPYDLQAQLMARVRPPEPLQLIASRWEFQDANWFPDFPAAAKKIRWFWSKAGQPTVDGVIAVNAPIVIELLKVTGPIDMPEYGKTITAENFILETQKAVELEYDIEENKPKKFIGDLMPKLLERLKDSSQEDLLLLAGVMIEALEKKDIQIALTNDEEEARIEALDWNGRLKETPGDSLAVIGANIAGQKTDLVIDEDVKVKTQIREDGSITNTVTIKRMHHGVKGETFYGVNNVNYLRLYVPEGSTLMSAEGFDPPPKELFDEVPDYELPDEDLERLVKKKGQGSGGVDITNEFGRTVFGGWVQVDVGETAETTFTYKLPFTTYDLANKLSRGIDERNADGAYTALYTSQSGKTNRQLEVDISFPEHWQISWSTLQFEEKGAWDRDRATGILFETHE